MLETNSETLTMINEFRSFLYLHNYLLLSKIHTLLVFPIYFLGYNQTSSWSYETNIANIPILQIRLNERLCDLLTVTQLRSKRIRIWIQVVSLTSAFTVLTITFRWHICLTGKKFPGKLKFANKLFFNEHKSKHR